MRIPGPASYSPSQPPACSGGLTGLKQENEQRIQQRVGGAAQGSTLGEHTWKNSCGLAKDAVKMPSTYKPNPCEPQSDSHATASDDVPVVCSHQALIGGHTRFHRLQRLLSARPQKSKGPSSTVVIRAKSHATGVVIIIWQP